MPLAVAALPCLPEISLLVLQVGLARTVERKLGRKLPKPLPSVGAEGPPTPAPTQPVPILFTLALALPALLLGTDPEETILHAFKVFDTEGKGFIKADL